MVDNDAGDDAPTRREYLRVGGALVGSGLLAGCTGGAPDATPTDAATETGGSTGTSAPSDASTPTDATDAESTATESEDGAHSVTMEPMGTVEFASPPETWMAYFSTYGDMGIALGQFDGLEALIFTENWPLRYYEYLPGIDVSFDGVRQLMGESGIDKEAFYELDCDVHLFDPNFIGRLDDSWETEDFDEIADAVGPIVGNSIRRRDEDWHDYPYYSLYEAFGKVADVFGERERYRALKEVHDGLVSDVQSRLPPEDDRPEIGLLSINSNFEDGAFYAYPIDDGNGKKQYRDLGIRDAFGPHIDGGYAEWDYEQILDVDPDILVFSYGFSHATTEQFEARMRAMRDDPVGSTLSAVKNDRLYRGGTTYQGPIVNLFQTEIAAKQFYPDVFGEWTDLDTLAVEDEWLFDHRRVANVVRGDL